jgi:hypothetical protein
MRWEVKWIRTVEDNDEAEEELGSGDDENGKLAKSVEITFLSNCGREKF